MSRKAIIEQRGSIIMNTYMYFSTDQEDHLVILGEREVAVKWCIAGLTKGNAAKRYAGNQMNYTVLNIKLNSFVYQMEE